MKYIIQLHKTFRTDVPEEWHDKYDYTNKEEAIEDFEKMRENHSGVLSWRLVQRKEEVLDTLMAEGKWVTTSKNT